MLTTDQKQKIVAALVNNRQTFGGSDAKYAVSMGINKSVLARLKKGETERVLAEAKWIHIARKLEVRLGNEAEWITAVTPVYSYIIKQLTHCQRHGTSGIYCDRADIGKTHSAREYIKQHSNAVYVDCSQVKTRQKLIRQIAREFGVDHNGKYSDVFQDLVWYVKSIPNPMIILDEAGDLDYPAFLELKALWNAAENYCGWYMMGADGLQKKMERAISHKKVGYTEIFSRYGAKYQAIVPKSSKEADAFTNQQAATLIKTNLPNADIQTLLAKCKGSLRRVKIEVSKIKRTAGQLSLTD